MAHDIDEWGENRLTVPKPLLTAKDKKKASHVFEAYASSMAEMVCEDIFDNYNSSDRVKRSEAKEMLTKMKDKIFQTKATEEPAANDNGAIQEETAHVLLNFIKQQRLEDQGKDQIDENNDGSTFCT